MFEKLKEYKELLGIVVFFLGGFFCIQNQFTRFPTKSDVKSEVSVLHCLLDKYMLLTQRQLRGRELERQVQDLTSQISAYDDRAGAQPAISPAMREEREAKLADLVSARNDLKANAADIQKTGDELQRNVCGKGDQ
jgi:hypothetical protein